MGSQTKVFRARLGPGGKYGEVPFVTVPFDVKRVWGKGKVPVRGSVNGIPFRTTVGRMAGRYCFCVNATMRAGAGIGVGDTARFVLEPDPVPRTIKLPSELTKGLGVNLCKRLEDLAYTHKKEFVLWFTSAKKVETSERRLAKMKQMLAAGETIS